MTLLLMQQLLLIQLLLIQLLLRRLTGVVGAVAIVIVVAVAVVIIWNVHSSPYCIFSIASIIFIVMAYL